MQIIICRTITADPERAARADELMRQAISLLEDDNDDSNNEAA